MYKLTHIKDFRYKKKKEENCAGNISTSGKVQIPNAPFTKKPKRPFLSVKYASPFFMIFEKNL